MDSPASSSTSSRRCAAWAATKKPTRSRQKAKKAGELVKLEAYSANCSNRPRRVPPRCTGFLNVMAEPYPSAAGPSAAVRAA